MDYNLIKASKKTDYNIICLMISNVFILGISTTTLFINLTIHSELYNITLI